MEADYLAWQDRNELKGTMPGETREAALYVAGDRYSVACTYIAHFGGINIGVK